MLDKKDQMHPEDRRNLIIFLALAVLVYFSYDHFIMKPKLAALQEARQATAAHEAGLIASGQVEEKLLPRADVLKQVPGERIRIDNDEIFGSLALTGGRIDDIALHKHFTALDKKTNVPMLSPAGSEHARYAEFGWIADEKNLALPDNNTVWAVAGENRSVGPGRPVQLSWNNGQGLVFGRELSVDDKMIITVRETVTNNTGRAITFYPYALIMQHDLPSGFVGAYTVHEGPIGYIGDELYEPSYKEIREEGAQTYTAERGWAGLSEKYWFTGLIPDQDEQVTYRFSYVKPQALQGKDRWQVDLMGAPQPLSAGATAHSLYHLYTGAKKVSVLDGYEETMKIPHFDLVVDFGIYYFITKPFFYAVHFLGEKTGNYGIAIILFTIILRIFVFPLANTSFRSFAKLKKVGPETIELRNQYGDDKVKLQQELVKLYQREKVNPMAGCLPILIQIPIFFALYKVLILAIEMRHEKFLYIADLSAPDPAKILNLFGLLPFDPPGFLGIGILAVLLGITMWLTFRMNPTAMDPIQQQIFSIMPWVLMFVMAPFAAGLLLYWVTSNVLTLAQQSYLYSRHPQLKAQADKDKADQERAKGT